MKKENPTEPEPINAWDGVDSRSDDYGWVREHPEMDSEDTDDYER